MVKKEPENKWFRRELAISYMERGFTQKAYFACEAAYAAGCRDLDFVLMYAIECDGYGEYDKGVEILFEISGGYYYEKYPKEKEKAMGKVISDGMSDEPYVQSSKKIGRNDPCPCGSGKKYKHCCMKKQM